jgi:DNA-binding NarL/FixJ family response regulator
MTEREQQVGQMLSNGMTVGEIADALGVARSEAAALVKAYIDEHGSPILNRVDGHIARARAIDLTR